MKRIVFVSPPFAGHFNPLLVLAGAAQQAGYETEFITGPRKFPTLAARSLPAAALPSIADDALESIANTARPVRNHPLRLYAQFRQNLRLLPAIAADLEARWRANPPGLIVADSVAPVAELVADRLGIPWITTIATPFAIETRRGTPTYCGGWLPPATFAGRLRDAAGRSAIRAFKRSVALLCRREFRAIGLRRLYRDDGSEAIYSPHAILGFGLRELEFPRDWPSAFEMVGPIIASPESPAVALPAGWSRVLVTLGTHLLWAKRTLLDEVRALARTAPGVEFVVSLGDPSATAPPPEARIRTVPYIDYAAQLSDFDGVIHHGGAGITYAAILAGIPSLVTPRDYDQFDYAARIVHHGLGLKAASIAGASRVLPRLLDRDRWRALDRFRQLARAYCPERRFLEIVKRFSQSF